jgi:hypothetical protein
MRSIILIVLFILLFSIDVNAGKDIGFTQEDRERMIRMETTLQNHMQMTDKRFEQVDKRFEELREDMNKRFEQVDKRFEQMMNFLWILTGIFTTLTLGVIGFAYWDRRTIIEKSKIVAVDEVDKRYKMQDMVKLLDAAREYAKEDPRMERILKGLHLL